MKTVAIVLSTVFFALPVHAQNLTKTEEGNIVLSQCYQDCGAPVWEGAQGEIEQDRWFLVLLHDAAWSGALGTAAFDIYTDRHDDMRCAGLVNAINEMNVCQYKCRDLEAVYTQSTTLSKTRFNAMLSAGVSRLQSAGFEGLSYGTDEFSSACQTLLRGSSEGQSRVREGASAIGLGESLQTPSVFGIIQND